MHLCICSAPPPPAPATPHNTHSESIPIRDLSLTLHSCHNCHNVCTGLPQEVLHAIADKHRKQAKRPQLVGLHGRVPAPQLVALMKDCWHPVSLPPHPCLFILAIRAWQRHCSRQHPTVQSAHASAAWSGKSPPNTHLTCSKTCLHAVSHCVREHINFTCHTT